MADGDPMVMSHLGASVLLANPSAEIGILTIANNWLWSGALAGTHLKDNAQAHAGTYSQSFTLDATQTAPLEGYYYLRYVLPIPTGWTADKFMAKAIFSFFAWLRTTDPTHLTFKTRISLCDSAWTEISGQDKVVAPAANTWTKVSDSVDLGATPSASLYGIEYRLYIQLATDNAADTPAVYWDDLSMTDSYTFVKNPSLPHDPKPFLTADFRRLVNNTLVDYVHPSVQAKVKVNLRFGLIKVEQLLRLYQFWLHQKAVTWTPNLPTYPSTLKVRMTGKEFTYSYINSVLGVGYRLDIPIEEV